MIALQRRLEFLFPLSILQYSEVLADSIATVAVVAACYEAWQLWLCGKTDLPGVLSAVPDFSGQGSSSGSGRFAMVDFSTQVRIIVNIALAGPLQCLYALQRFRNLIPNSPDNEATLSKWREFAKGQSGWHSANLYGSDYESMHRLIKMGHFDFSPTKGKVCLSR